MRMQETLSQVSRGRLERLCKAQAGGARLARDAIRVAPGAEGIERLEAHFTGQAFAPHRHDTYAIGITLSGVQRFSYRGERRQCLPGQVHILHPDETHDGAAGTDEGFGYRIVYVDPALVQEALGGLPLPFVADPVADAALLPKHLVSALWAFDQELDELALSELVATLADMLLLASGSAARPASLPLAALLDVRELLAACPATRHRMAELERLSGLDRWSLARQFRAAFGTSPGRFRAMRQLDLVRRLARDGVSLAAASAEAGFSDQSHMTRQFKRAYGRTPGEWAAAVA
jgi:AraC-like DNA-binding protein/quercetin dioxygenase-like cupin family protein